MGNIKRGEIYLADLASILGSEQDGIRPVLCIQNDVGNKYSHTTIIAPITSKQTKADLPTHVKLSSGSLDKESIVLLEQIKTIDTVRLGDRIGKLSKDDMGKVDHAIIVSLGIKYMEELLDKKYTGNKGETKNEHK